MGEPNVSRDEAPPQSELQPDPGEADYEEVPGIDLVDGELLPRKRTRRRL